MQPLDAAVRFLPILSVCLTRSDPYLLRTPNGVTGELLGAETASCPHCTPIGFSEGVYFRHYKGMLITE